MARYVDGFVIPVPKRNIAAYRRMGQKAGKVWLEHGALEFRECVGDDLAIKGTGPFLARRSQSPAKPSFSRGSCSSRTLASGR